MKAKKKPNWRTQITECFLRSTTIRKHNKLNFKFLSTRSNLSGPMPFIRLSKIFKRRSLRSHQPRCSILMIQTAKFSHYTAWMLLRTRRIRIWAYLTRCKLFKKDLDSSLKIHLKFLSALIRALRAITQSSKRRIDSRCSSTWLIRSEIFQWIKSY
jgi:hypothetical protein